MIKVVEQRIQDLRTNALNLWKGLTGDLGARWSRFGEGTVPFDPESVRAGFPIEPAIQAYKKAIDAGEQDYTSRDATVAKMQGDFISSLNMGVNLRHRTRVQAVACDAARARAHNEKKIERAILRPIVAAEGSK